MDQYYAAILAAFIFFCGLAYERWNLRAELRGVEKLANWYARNLFRDTTAFYESLEKRLDDVEAKVQALEKAVSEVAKYAGMIEENANG